ncbi:endolytic transglycosylase MltG [Sphingomonas sp. ID1715]|uniref:endolytic transglycosylase MltG n=1 Tax=Sphingomonas sp. ID1715 TaxID=1656898 RepID=UPI001488DE64|nr:endolytic transglycosylase MltG [Sphingomonas sp. ID1715]NNM76559.1 endolytic transglycosylase MltG [Sphingomonas sp. ID1715]
MRRLLLLLVALALIAGGATFLSWTGAGPAPKAVAVTVPEGGTLRSAARELEKAGAIASADRFYLLARLFGGEGTIRAGEYEVPKHASAREIVALLQSGKTLQRLVTIPEGMPSILVHEKLMATPLLTGSAPVPAEGSVLPDSYSYQRGERRAAVLKRMTAAMDKALAELWAKRKPGAVVRTPQEAVTLAAIVEKETGVPAERRMVAGVYSNRLRIGMPLQADPTVIYPVTKGKPLGRRILQSELHADNGYNTYARAGLPLGPIANPGKASIAAVLDPAPTKALYFVAKGDGGHVFADTLAEHNANVARWYAIRRARGEM